MYRYSVIRVSGEQVVSIPFLYVIAETYARCLE